HRGRRDLRKPASDALSSRFSATGSSEYSACRIDRFFESAAAATDALAVGSHVQSIREWPASPGGSLRKCRHVSPRRYSTHFSDQCSSNVRIAWIERIHQECPA